MNRVLIIVPVGRVGIPAGVPARPLDIPAPAYRDTLVRVLVVSIHY